MQRLVVAGSPCNPKRPAGHFVIDEQRPTSLPDRQMRGFAGRRCKRREVLVGNLRQRLTPGKLV